MITCSLKNHLGLGVILIAFLALGIIYSTVTPILEGCDELEHYQYVRHLVAGHGLPVQLPGFHPHEARQEGSQPPLYYMLVAAATAWVDTAGSTIWRNPHANPGVPDAHANKNVLVHTSKEDFPYQGATLAIHLARWFTVVMGAVTVLGAYLLARELVPGSPVLALAGASLVAFTPQYLFVSATVGNDALVAALSAVGLWLMVALVRRGVAWGRLTVLSGVLGLAALTKLSALGLIPLALSVVSFLAWRRRSWRDLWSWNLVLLSGPLALAGWWYARNWALYGEPLGLEMMLDVAGRREMPATLWQILTEAEGVRLSFWSLFGKFNILADAPVYWFFDGLTIAALVGWLVILFRRLRRKTPVSALFLIPLVWFTIEVAALARWTAVTPGSQGRLLFPALSAVAVLLAQGLAGLTCGRARTLLLITVGGVALAVAAIAPFRYIAPTYARPVPLTPAELQAIPHSLAVDFGGQMELLGYELVTPKVTPGGYAEVTLWWRALAPMSANYSVFLHLTGPNNQPTGQLDTYPGRGLYPTSLWTPGEAIRDTYHIPVATWAIAPGVAQLSVGLYRLDTGQRLMAHGSGIHGDRVPLGQVSVSPGPGVSAEIAYPLYASFRDEIALLGYDISSTRVQPGNTVHFTFAWQALSRPQHNYAMFLHLVDLDYRGLGQYDAPPVRLAGPTAGWPIGPVMRDEEVRLLVGEKVPPGEYRLIVGLYDPATLSKLPIVHDGLFVELGHLWVEPATP